MSSSQDSISLRVLLQLLLLTFASLTNAEGSATSRPPQKAASIANVSAPLSRSFVGFGIEPTNLFSFTGAERSNAFSLQLFQNLANYAGAPPHIRLGGNTQDYMIYDSTYNAYFVATNPSPKGQGAIPSDLHTFGPKFWEVIDRFPSQTPVTFGLNLAYSDTDWSQKIVNSAQAAVRNIKKAKLFSFEIGNEPDLYYNNGFRSTSYVSSDYINDWLLRADVVWSEVLQPAGLPSTFFEPGTTASTIGTTFEISKLAAGGILSGSSGASSFVSSWNQHDYFYFLDVSTYGLTLAGLQQLSKTESQFTAWAGQVNQAQDTGIPYNLREMASAGPTGIQHISDTFGAALWTLNFFCYAATLNISSVQMHMTDNSFASPWAPVQIDGIGPIVRPTYTAFAAMTQIIGTGNGTLQMASLPLEGITSSYKDYVRAYSFYNKGDLAGVVIINGKVANSTTSASDRVGVNLNIILEGVGGQKLWLQTLSAQGADATSGATWNGINYDENADGTPKQISSTTDVVEISSDGKTAFTVNDSQAIVATINFQIGGGKQAKKRNAATEVRSGGIYAAIFVGVMTSIWALF
jgi:hypothetical protein